MTSSAQSPAPGRPADFPFSDWQIGVEDAAGRLTGRARNCARNAFLHLRGAWHLHYLDDEMAAFRAITAEEEAATALIQALKARRYAGAERLRPWNHVHKSAFWPLVDAVNRVLVASGMPAPKVALSRKGPPRVALKIDVAAMTGSKEPLWGEPDHPLNFVLRAGDETEPLLHFFEKQFAELAAERGARSLKEHVEREANLRNRLLYADDAGCPSVSFDDDMLRARALRVGILVILAIIVMQTTERQLFVTQCLEALLRVLDAQGGIAFDYADATPPRDRQLLMIRRMPGEDAKVSLRRPIAVDGVWGNQGWGFPAPLRSAKVVVRFFENDAAEPATSNG